MKKFNAIHILEEKQKPNDLIHRNLGKEYYQEQLTRFVNKYILPQLVKLNNEGKITYNLNTDDTDIFFKSKQLEIYVYDVVEVLAIQNDVDMLDIQNDDIDVVDVLDNQNDVINFLNTNDKKLIKAVVNDICDFILDTYEEFIVDYDNQ